jgi:predicted O-methyltransferase YrrM
MLNQEYLVTPTYYDMKSGTQEYRLYSYLTTFFNDTTIIDLGTSHGTSAVSLSHNPTNQVISYDIEDGIHTPGHKIYSKENIEFRIKDILEDLNEENVSTIHYVMIDIDHYGSIEKKLIDRLHELHFSGIILLDDVFHHPDTNIKQCMQELWDSIPYEKYNITKYAHWSGTGLILMNTDIKFVFE